MEFLARVNPRYFAAIELFSAKNDVRYYLNGVCIEPHPERGVIIVATNGHRLAAIHDPDGWCKKTLIVGDIPKGLIAACKAKGNPATLTEPKALWISKTGAVVMPLATEEQGPDDPFDKLVLYANKISLIDGVFPDWRRVVPTERTEKAERLPAVNPKYLSDLNAAAGLLGIRHLSIRLEANGEGLPIVARMDASDLLDRFIGIIMPVRSEPIPTIAPSWLMPKQKPRVKFRGGALVTDEKPTAEVAAPAEETKAAA